MNSEGNAFCSDYMDTVMPRSSLLLSHGYFFPTQYSLTLFC